MEQQEQKKSVGVIEHLSSLKAMQVADDSKVKDKFIMMVEAIHGPGIANAFYEAERHYFQKLILENKDLQNCTRLSLYGAFIDCAVNRLSFDPQRKLAYLLWDNHKIGVDANGNDQYEKRARMAISPYGELFLRQQFGQIKSADNPEVVYEGEKFTKISGKDGTLISHEINWPRPNTDLVAAYIRFVKPDGSVDYFVMDMIQMARLKEYSARKNYGKASKMYGDEKSKTKVDTGFLIAKTIKHAFKSYPKVKLKGDFTVLETELEEDPIDGAVNYDIVPDPNTEQKKETEHPVNTTNEETAKMTMTPDPKPEATTETPKERNINF